MAAQNGQRWARIAPATFARCYFAVQAIAGAAWWIAVAISADVREWTLGGLPVGWLVVPDLVLFVGASALAAGFRSRTVAAVTAGWTVVVTGALAGYATVERRAGWGAVLMVLASTGTIASTLALWFGRLPTHWIVVGPFRFRSAVVRARSAHLRHSLMQLVVFWSAFLIALPLLLGWVERRWRLVWDALHDATWRQPVGVGVFIIASGLGLWSCISMALRGEGTPLPSSTARKLVAVGPYRVVRNPMAVAGALQTVGVGLWLGSWMVLASALAGCVVWDVLIRPQEEADLAARFGTPYDDYRRSVRRWIPAASSLRGRPPRP